MSTVRAVLLVFSGQVAYNRHKSTAKDGRCAPSPHFIGREVLRVPFQVNTAVDRLIYYLVSLLYTVPVLLIAFPVHECAHGWVAWRLGDDTAKRAGRLTLNPFRHLDFWGTVCLIVARFGWAKPVPINPYNFRDRKAGMALTALAGPFSNLIMAFLSLVLLRLFSFASGVPAVLSGIVSNLLVVSAEINAGLFVFNLIPIPPLDGSRILAIFLPERAEEAFYRYGSLPAMLLVFFFWRYISSPVNAMVSNVLSHMTSLLRF